MKTIPQSYLTAVGKTVLTLSNLWRLELTDGTVLGFTSFNRDIVLSDDPGVIYKAKTGFTPTAISTSEKFNVDNLEVQGYLVDDEITASDLNAGRYDNAKVIVSSFDWMNKPYAKSKNNILMVGKLGEVRMNNSTYQAEVRSLTQEYQYNVGPLLQPSCRALLGDSICQKDLTNFRFNSVVEAVSSNRVITCNLEQDDKFYTNGVVKFTSGLNNGLKREVKHWTLSNKTLELQLPMNFKVEIGDTFEITAGCDGVFDTCVDIFDNAVNFDGEPDIPGQDFLMGGKLQ